MWNEKRLTRRPARIGARGSFCVGVLAGLVACASGPSASSSGTGASGASTGGAGGGPVGDACEPIRACVLERLAGASSASIDELRVHFNACTPSRDANLFQRVVLGIGHEDPESPFVIQVDPEARCQPG